MAIPSGLSAQAGIKTEAAYGTAVVVDTFMPIVSESMAQDITRIQSMGIRANRRTAHTWKAGGITNSGSLVLELSNAPLATLMTHMFGSVATVGAGPYTHTGTPGDLTGKSFTLQVGIPDVGGTVRTKTYAGSKIPSWEVACGIGEIPRLTLDVSAKTEVTNVAVASASYLAGSTPFVFTQASLSIDATPVATVRSFSLAALNSLAVDRHRMGSSTVLQQIESGQREYTGSISADFEDLTHYGRFVAGTEAALVLGFDNGVDSLTITSNVRFDGTTPQVSGMELLEQPLPFFCTSGASDGGAITAVLVNAEASAA